MDGNTQNPESPRRNLYHFSTQNWAKSEGLTQGTTVDLYTHPEGVLAIVPNGEGDAIG